MHLTKGELGVWVVAICFVLFLLFGFDWVS
jgi:hypothetical protein